MKEYRLKCMRCSHEAPIRAVRLQKDDEGLNVVLMGTCTECNGRLVANSHVAYESVPHAFYVDPRQGSLFVN